MFVNRIQIESTYDGILLLRRLFGETERSATTKI